MADEIIMEEKQPRICPYCIDSEGFHIMVDEGHVCSVCGYDIDD